MGDGDFLLVFHPWTAVLCTLEELPLSGEVFGNGMDFESDDIEDIQF